jgi:hypothetical protein
MKRILTYCILGAMFAVLICCKKDPEKPPLMNMLGHKVYSVPELKAIASCTNNCSKKFTGEVYFIGVVVADSYSGNFFKELYVRDRYNTGGIHLSFNQAAYMWVGDSVRVNLKDLNVSINPDTDMLEIDSLDWEKYVVKFATGAKPEPRVISIQQFASNMDTYLCDLVKITDVAFTPTDAAQPWANAIAGQSLNRILQDCSNNQLIVRTSNYAKFASQNTPTGAGTIVGIATAYKGTPQMELRNVAETQMTGAGCMVYLQKDFNNDSIISPKPSQNWIVAKVTNTAVAWAPYTFGTDKFAKVSGYISGNTNSECWMISPAMNLNGSTNPVLTFRTAAKFTGPVLEVKVSTNYVAGLPSTATWSVLSGYTLSSNNPGTYSWTPSGNVSLNAFKSANTRIAFSYSSTTSASSTYEVDDILVKEN